MTHWSDIESWVFDLDNTLYPASCDLFAQVDVRMRDFISDYLNLGKDEARKLQKTYFHECGTTLRGLMTHHNIDPKPYLDYVHNIDVTPVPPAPDLATALKELPGKKYIFTNASTAHATRVMDRLGVTGQFEGVFDIIDADYQPKPEPSIYNQFIEKFKIDPTRAVMVEDIVKNLKPANELGMQCVWIKTDTSWGKENAQASYVHHETDNLLSWLQDILKVQ